MPLQQPVVLTASHLPLFSVPLTSLHGPHLSPAAIVHRNIGIRYHLQNCPSLNLKLQDSTTIHWAGFVLLRDLKLTLCHWGHPGTTLNRVPVGFKTSWSVHLVLSLYFVGSTYVHCAYLVHILCISSLFFSWLHTDITLMLVGIDLVSPSQVNIYLTVQHINHSHQIATVSQCQLHWSRDLQLGIHTCVFLVFSFALHTDNF